MHASQLKTTIITNVIGLIGYMALLLIIIFRNMTVCLYFVLFILLNISSVNQKFFGAKNFPILKKKYIISDLNIISKMKLKYLYIS